MRAGPFTLATPPEVPMLLYALFYLMVLLGVAVLIFRDEAFRWRFKRPSFSWSGVVYYDRLSGW